MPEACTDPRILEETKLWNGGVAMLGETVPLIPIFATYSILLLHVHHGVCCGAASGQEPSELVLERAKQEGSCSLQLYFCILLFWRLCCLGEVSPVTPCMLGKEKACMLKKSHGSRLALSTWGWHPARGCVSSHRQTVTWNAEAGPCLLCEQSQRAFSWLSGWGIALPWCLWCCVLHRWWQRHQQITSKITLQNSSSATGGSHFITWLF